MKCKWRLDDGQIEVVDEAVAAILRQKTPAERVAMTVACHRTMRKILEAAVRTRHPDWDEAHVHKEIARRISGGAR